MRVVFLLRHCGSEPGPLAPQGALTEMRSQLRLQALDFWLRNPDYLADELLNEYERTGDRTLVDEARRILGDREPEVRRLPMTKYLRGAYEPLDDVLAPLVTYGLVQHAATADQTRVREHDYWFMPLGEQFAEALLQASSGAAVAALASLADERPVANDRVVQVPLRSRRGAITEAVRLLDGAEVAVEDIVLHRPTLDDVFIALTGRAARDAEHEEEGRHAREERVVQEEPA